MFYLDSKPIHFHKYASSTKKRILSIPYNTNDETGKEIEYLRHQLIEHFNHCGIKCDNDNKIVFECETYFGIRLFYGFYDLTFSIGMSYS